MPKKGSDGKYHSKVIPAKGAKPIYFSAKTLKEFNEKRQQIVSEYRENGYVTKKKDVLFSDLAEEWWKDIKSPRIKNEGTKSRYNGIIHNWIIPFFSQKSVKAVRYSDLQKCVDQLYGKSDSIINHTIHLLRWICSYAVKERILPFNYALELEHPIPGEKEERLPLTHKQGKALRKLFDKHLDCAVLYYTGMRIGEMLGLQWKDVDFDKHRIHVCRSRKRRDIGSTKTKAGVRFIPMPEELETILYAVRGLPEQYVFHNPNGGSLNLSSERKRWQAVRSNPLLSEITPHWLRHNYAAGLYLAGIPSQVSCVWLGHSSPTITLNTYTHIKEILETIDEPDMHLAVVLKKVAEKLRDTSKTYQNIV